MIYKIRLFQYDLREIYIIHKGERKMENSKISVLIADDNKEFLVF